MITKQRYIIESLPVIPADATFIINKRYAKIENDILFLWNKVSEGWDSTNKTLSEVNDYQVSEYHEYTLGQIMYRELHFAKADYSGFNYRYSYSETQYHVFKDWDDEYKISLFKPIAKGFKGKDRKTRYGGGAIVVIRSELYPQLDELVGDNIVECIPSQYGLD